MLQWEILYKQILLMQILYRNNVPRPARREHSRACTYTFLIFQTVFIDSFTFFTLDRQSESVMYCNALPKREY